MIVLDERIPVDEDIIYIAGKCVYDKLDIFTYEGVGPKGIYYIGGNLSTGEILSKILWKPKTRLDFGDLGPLFSFHNASICEVRRMPEIVKLEMETGVDYSHLEDVIGMPWSQIYSTLNDARRLGKLDEVKLIM